MPVIGVFRVSYGFDFEIKEALRPHIQRSGSDRSFLAARPDRA